MKGAMVDLFVEVQVGEVVVVYLTVEEDDEEILVAEATGIQKKLERLAKSKEIRLQLIELRTLNEMETRFTNEHIMRVTP